MDTATRAIAGVLEDALEGPLHLDLNNPAQNRTFQELVAAIAQALEEAGELPEFEYTIAETTRGVVTYVYRDSPRPTLAAVKQDLVEPTDIIMQRRKAGEWEVMPTTTLI